MRARRNRGRRVTGELQPRVEHGHVMRALLLRVGEVCGVQILQVTCIDVWHMIDAHADGRENGKAVVAG